MMHFLRTSLVTFLIVFGASAVFAAGDDFLSLGHLKMNPRDNASLQRGAQTFMNYCSGCHSLKYLRYSGMAKGIGITDEQGNIAEDLVKNNLIFTDAKIHDQIKVAMKPLMSSQWFGVAPPDLTMITRLRGQDWVYNYLLGFYQDKTRPWGVNNAIYPDVAMPHVLAELQGVQEPIYHEVTTTIDGEPQEHRTIVGMKLVKPGQLTPAEYQSTVTDLVNFLVFAAEPTKSDRMRMGLYVILFLTVLLCLAYLLKREYWKQVH